MSSGSNIFAGTADSGVYLSTDNGIHWTSANGNLPDRRISTLESSRNVIITTTSAGSFFSNNNGASWLNFRTSIPNHTDTIYYYALCDSTIIAETVGGKAYKFSYENSQSPWIQISDTFLNAGHLNAVAMCGGNIVLGVGFNMYYSTDQGISWRISTNNTNSQGLRSIVKSGRNLFTINTGLSICSSMDNGITWNYYLQGLPKTTIECEYFWVSDLYGNDNTVLLSGALHCMGGEGGLFWTSSNAIGWNQVSTNTQIGFRTVWGTNVFADMDSTLFINTNKSIIWTNISANLPRDQISGVVVSGNNIVVGTKSHGVWHRPLADLVGVKMPQHREKDFNFEISINGQFERTIAMNISLVHKSHISATVFDIAGHKVTRLFEGDLGIGKWQISCNKFNLSAGHYIIQVLADRKRYFKKVTVFQ